MQRKISKSPHPDRKTMLFMFLESSLNKEYAIFSLKQFIYKRCSTYTFMSNENISIITLAKCLQIWLDI